MALNNSPSKHKFSFGKDSRFKNVRTHTDINAYELPDMYNIQKKYDELNDHKGFGSSLEDRFNYLGPNKNHSSIHTYISNQYRYHNESTMSCRSSKKYTFGLGRQQMNPIHVDDVVRKN